VHIRIEKISKVYEEHHVNALKEIDLSFERGEFVAVMGPSGCGKSTFLNLLAGIDRPSSGKIYIGDTEITHLSDADLTHLRRDKIGFVFQFFNLLSTLTAAENVSLPLELAGKLSAKEIRQRCLDTLTKVSLAGRADFYPSQMSGGEMQRVAIARAIIHAPELIVADEPTGNLDTENGEQVLRLFRDLCKEGRHTAIMATHSLEAAAYADRTIHLKDGRLVEISRT
jgi:putative ABC transport system ATP-binding protein